MLSLLHRILARVLPDDANDTDGDREYQLERAKILEEGFAGEYWLEVAGFSTELSKRDCDRVSDILQMFRIITFSIDHLDQDGVPVDRSMASGSRSRASTTTTRLRVIWRRTSSTRMRDDRWSELKPQVERSDGGNSHARMLDTYMRMLAEYRRVTNSRPARSESV